MLMAWRRDRNNTSIKRCEPYSTKSSGGNILPWKPDKKHLLITADGGGSNGVRNRLWKKKLQELANEEQLSITVAHYPPATSKWNTIEHRLFSFISINWRAKPLTSLEVVLELMHAYDNE
jgi:hypothetical protein